MYESYWGLNERPFKNLPDPKYFFLGSQYLAALMKLEYLIRQDMGAGLLSGVFGCGKTMLINYLIRELEGERYKFLKILFPPPEQRDILTYIARSLSGKQLPLSRQELSTDVLIELIEKSLKNNLADGTKTVIIVDEAHLIKDLEALEQLRTILNFQDEKHFYLSLILSGQPEILEIISESKQLAQRIALRAHLSNLNDDETSQYIKHRLTVAGAKKEIFHEEAISLIYTYSAGIPRRINTLCDLALLNGYGLKKDKIDCEIVEIAQKEFMSNAEI